MNNPLDVKEKGIFQKASGTLPLFCSARFTGAGPYVVIGAVTSESSSPGWASKMREESFTMETLVILRE